MESRAILPNWIFQTGSITKTDHFGWIFGTNSSSDLGNVEETKEQSTAVVPFVSDIHGNITGGI